MNTLGQRIKLARGKISQDHFAAMIEVSKGSLGFYERDENLPNSKTITKICSATGVSLEWLLLGTGAMRPDQPPAQPDSANSSVAPSYDSAERYARLEAKLEKVERQRDELMEENRQLWRENGQLREKVAHLEEAAYKSGMSGGDIAQSGAA